MLKFYLTTVIIWMIIIYCVVAIFQHKLAERFRVNEEKKAGLFKKLRGLFILAAIPIIRLLIVIVLIYIAICKQEDFDELMKRANNN